MQMNYRRALLNSFTLKIQKLFLLTNAIHLLVSPENRTSAQLRHLTTTTRIHHVIAFWCKLDYLLFKPRGDC